MSHTKSILPTITINGKQNCINVGRDVIRALEYPSHICILEHDKWQVIAVTSCSEEEILSFRVPDGFPDDRGKKFRIYSQSLVREILTDCSLDTDGTYNLRGEFIQPMNAVLFHTESIKEAVEE